MPLPDRMLEVEPTAPLPSSRALVPVGRVCPECGGALMTYTAAQPALFRHGGYGAVRRTEWDMCPACCWSVERASTEVNPRRF